MGIDPPITYGLTRRQRETLAFIQAYIDGTGNAPSYVDIAAGCNLKSRSEVNRRVRALCDRGWLGRLPGRARSLQVLRRLPPIEEPAVMGFFDPDPLQVQELEAARRAYRDGRTGAKDSAHV